MLIQDHNRLSTDAHIKFFSVLRGEWNMMMKHRDMITAVRRHYNTTYQDNEKQNAINVFLGQSWPQVGRPALWELRSDQRNTGSSPNLDIENLRPKIPRSFSDNLLLEGVDLEEPVLEDLQPFREGLKGGWETTSEFGFFEAEPASPCVPSAVRDEDHLRGTGSRQMFPGSSSLAIRLILAGSMMYLVFHIHTMLNSLRQMKCLNVTAPCRQITCSPTWKNPSLLQLTRTFLRLV